MPLKPLACTAAIMLGLISTSALASVVVVKSRGPSAKTYPPGKTLTSTTKLTLQNGDVVTILGPGSVRTLRGPGSFDTTQVGLEEASSQRGRFGAMRTGGVAHSPSIWDIDVTRKRQGLHRGCQEAAAMAAQQRCSRKRRNSNC